MKRLLMAACLALVFLGTGCTTGNFGGLASRPELLTAFSDRTLDSSYHYYYCGRSGLPYAVVGIDKAYTFDSKFWFAIDSMDEVYNKIDHVTSFEPDQITMKAKDILAPDGSRIGVYFSYYYYTPVQVEGNRVQVFNPYKPENHLPQDD